MLNELIERSTKYWSFNPRTYHNLNHRDQVMYTLIGEMELVTLPGSVILAAAWHDAVYYPGAGADANERASAAALKQEFMAMNTDHQQHMGTVTEAMRLIGQTAIQVHLTPDHVTDYNLALLLDADLRSLALPYEEFLKNQENIVAENYGQWPDDRRRAAEFLKLFTRQFIYHTDAGRRLWEEKARQNIARLFEES